MSDEFVRLAELFCEHGGRFENMTIGYRKDSGYYCSAVDGHRIATVFCPAHLLVDVDDIGISEAGLFISRPENYASNMSFLEKYFSFHFNKRMVETHLEERCQIDALSEHEKLLLKGIIYPDVIDGKDVILEYIKQRILQTHQYRFEPLGNKVIMPFISFLNHDKGGGQFLYSKDGITVSGKFSGEVFVNYNMGDVLMLLGGYGFVTDSFFIYSLPMTINLPNGLTLKIKRDISNSTIIDGKFPWPTVEKKGDIITVSWFPMYYKFGPRYPARISASLAHEFNIPAENIIYSVFYRNLNAMLPVIFALKNSKNSYAQMVVSGIEMQLALIGGVTVEQ